MSIDLFITKVVVKYFVVVGVHFSMFWSGRKMCGRVKSSNFLENAPSHEVSGR